MAAKIKHSRKHFITYYNTYVHVRAVLAFMQCRKVGIGEASFYLVSCQVRLISRLIMESNEQISDTTRLHRHSYMYIAVDGFIIIVDGSLFTANFKFVVTILYYMSTYSLICHTKTDIID